ncbi:glycoside hydrolase family 95 protein [Pedobacter sp. MC2016-05]|uniref:glycoside hydrolase family 95 protein n=1 Tax=Pedobacter sp. MC2016-05 TaxID=2994474 RepID=UPI0022484C5B|nr:glycoside hydrolase family 95 protein [Pedobacter sp. MC2016-05]MCX2476994.1 glycoside hydrolase family 95 protein [Pedobacter sp. MC2016-05]
MKIKLIVVLLLTFQIVQAQYNKLTTQTGTSNLKLWYKKPAEKWMSQALPIGNGLIGAMIFGGVDKDQIQYNDKTLWTGSTTKRGSYQNFGDLLLEFEGLSNYSNYKRELDLETGISRVSFDAQGNSFLREYFASYVDQVITVRLTSSGKKRISFSAQISDPREASKMAEINAGNNEIHQYGKLDILNYAAILSVKNSGGKIAVEENKLVVKEADAVTLILSLGTNYDPVAPGYVGFDKEKLNSNVTHRNHTASKKPYKELLASHIKDYQSLFKRVSLEIGGSDQGLPTDELQAAYNKGNKNPYLESLYYQYGRYLMISSARGMALPSNLQGLWNNSNNPAWQADLHSDINVQMNYWPAEITNLSELHGTLLNYLYNEAMVQPSWRKAAKDDGTEGWSQWVQNNIFGYGDWAKTRPANAWYSMHLWQHYAFTLNKAYLKKTAYPVMKGACDFWLGRLVQSESGLVAPKEWSPEIGPWNVEGGVAYAQQLIFDLFSNTIKATEELGIDPDYRNKLKSTLAKLDKGTKIGNWGQLMEWNNEAIEKKHSGPKNTHRHLSHLIALYPGSQISPLIDTVYSNAAKTSLIGRGDFSTGWALAWRLACWARLLDGDHAHQLLKNSLVHIKSTEITYNEGGVYENLLNGPPFQIDGNFGITAGITEMLLQSHLGMLQILPALPSAWPKGAVSGLKAKGNFTVDISWSKGETINTRITSGSGSKCTIYLKNIKGSSVKDKNGKIINVKVINNDRIEFDTIKGMQYVIDGIPFNR